MPKSAAVPGQNPAQNDGIRTSLFDRPRLGGHIQPFCLACHTLPRASLLPAPDVGGAIVFSRRLLALRGERFQPDFGVDRRCFHILRGAFRPLGRLFYQAEPPTAEVIFFIQKSMGGVFLSPDLSCR